MLASDLIKSYESFCPPELSMEGDVVGLQIGSLDKEIQKVMVTLDVRENTVAEAIEMKNHGMDFKKLLKQKIKKQYDAAMAQIITENGKLEDKAENYVVGLYGSKEGKTSTEEFTKTREAYIEAQTMELVDPIGVLKEMEDLETEIAEFTAEVDAALSVSNSLTEIEITY